MTTVASIPTQKFTLTWGQNAGAGYIRTPPQASQIGLQNGAASFNDGFVPLNFTPVAAGGVPPYGQDMNGVLALITDWQQWEQAGGPISYDAAFSSAIGGYPKGAILAASSFNGALWLSTVDNNTTNPDAGGTGWAAYPQGLPYTWTQAQTFSATATFSLGATATGVDSGGAQFRAISGNYGALILNDGAQCYLLQTSGGTPYAGCNSYRPFTWSLTTGVVTIDGTGAGAYMGGALAVTGTITQAGVPVATQVYANTLPGRFLESQYPFFVSSTFAFPTGANYLEIEVFGAGGAGGAVPNVGGAGYASCGAGGGSGAYAKVGLTISGSGVTSLVITIGAGGTAPAGSGGSAGGATTVYQQDGVTALVSCPGGLAAPVGSVETASSGTNYNYFLPGGGSCGVATFYSPAFQLSSPMPGRPGEKAFISAFGPGPFINYASGSGSDGFGCVGTGGSEILLSGDSSPVLTNGNAATQHHAGGGGALSFNESAAAAGGSGGGGYVIVRCYT